MSELSETDLHRRQFLVSMNASSARPEWPFLTLPGGLEVAAHPELPCHEVHHGDVTFVVLGFFTDPDNPRRSTSEILRKLADEVGAGRSAVDCTMSLGGRWVLIVAEPARATAFTDPTGLRQLFYTDSSHHDLVCASQPGLIGEVLGLAVSQEASDEFIRHEVRPDREYWWPGDTSPLRGVRHLVPNHLLELNSREVIRFWPVVALEKVPTKVALERGAQLLSGQVASARHQFRLAQSITAGIDSRTVFAASREFADDIYHYTLQFGDLTPASPDLRVPAVLLGNFGLTHHVIPTPASMSDAFCAIFERNVLLAHHRWGAMLEGLANAYPRDRVAMDGSVSEVGRCFYYANGEHPSMVTALDLATMTHMTPTPFVLDGFQRWLDEALPAARATGIPLLDLFYWEQRAGNWAASALVELDLIQETFTPFNHRELLVLLLGVDRRLRRQPRYAFYRSLIRRLWPEALSQPINPGSVGKLAREFIVAGLQWLRLDGPLREARRRLGGL